MHKPFCSVIKTKKAHPCYCAPLWSWERTQGSIVKKLWSPICENLIQMWVPSKAGVFSLQYINVQLMRTQLFEIWPTVCALFWKFCQRAYTVSASFFPALISESNVLQFKIFPYPILPGNRSNFKYFPLCSILCLKLYNSFSLPYYAFLPLSFSFICSTLKANTVPLFCSPKGLISGRHCLPIQTLQQV